MNKGILGNSALITFSLQVIKKGISDLKIDLTESYACHIPFYIHTTIQRFISG